MACHVKSYDCVNVDLLRENDKYTIEIDLNYTNAI